MKRATRTPETTSSDDRQAWRITGAHEVSPGIYRIPLPMPGDYLHAVNVYAIVDGDGLVMIDGGEALAESSALLARCLRLIGAATSDIRDFLVTHVHRDHYTQAVALRRRHGSRVSLGRAERHTLEAVHRAEQFPSRSQLVAAGASELLPLLASRAPLRLSDYELPDAWLDDRAELPLAERRLRVIATPGHTRGHVVFHDADAGVLFGGDHVLPHITPSIGVEVDLEGHPTSPLADFLASLEIVRSLPDSLLLPAHGPAGGSTHARVDELLRHHEDRLRATLDAVRRGATSAMDAARLLPWTRGARPFEELDGFNQIIAVLETKAHLDVLAVRKSVAPSVDEAGVHVFSVVTGPDDAERA